MLYRGTINSSVVRVAEIFREAVRLNAVAIIVAHNHPSGDPEPSPEDIRVTGQLRRAGELMGIHLLDHIVVGKDCWTSLKEKGYGFK
jgi:DNA repair protein RadC